MIKALHISVLLELAIENTPQLATVGINASLTGNIGATAQIDLALSAIFIIREACPLVHWARKAKRAQGNKFITYGVIKEDGKVYTLVNGLKQGELVPDF